MFKRLGAGLSRMASVVMAKRLALFAIILFSLYWAYAHLAAAGFQYEWQWARVWRHFGRWGQAGFEAGPLCRGLILTVSITAAGTVLAVAGGMLVCLARLSPWPCAIWLARMFISLWRGTPLLLQLFFAYFLISPLLDLGPFWIATLTLGLFESAYLAEIFRAGILSVPQQQWEAGLSLGFAPLQVFRLAILPQVLANIQPALVNQCIAVLKDSSLVSAIAVADLTMRSQAIIAETFLVFEIWLLAGAIYLVLALFIALPGLWIEHKRQWR